jgi:hypothetical protein
VNKPLDSRRVQSELDAYLAQLLKELVNLRWALEQFGDDFDEAEWVACFESDVPAEQARRSTVLWPFANAFNALNEILRRASWIQRGFEPSPPEDMKTILRMLRQAGAMKSGSEKTLAMLNSRGRNVVTHRYPEADPRELRLTIIDFDRIQPQLRDGLDAWLVKKGYQLLPAQP